MKATDKSIELLPPQLNAREIRLDGVFTRDRVQMVLNLLHTITDFVVLVTRLTTEELADEQRMSLIDQYVHLQGLDAAFEFDLHDLLMILITILIIVFWRAWDSIDRWPFR